ncbi:MAG: M20/M25/M40 family metallo-hydrolase, partial [Chloroflexota bacterium]|nr:M20/M25/M40 family metallo-hydrolase [Chloroflexota bacterium]
VEHLVSDGVDLACTVDLLAAVDEETSGKGARAFVKRNPPASAAIIGEPTDCRVVNRHNGCVRGEIEVVGRSAHTSVAGEGINAIDGMADVIVALRAVNFELVNRPGGPAANGSLTVSLISGGTGINVVPERCVASYDRRIVPGQTSRHALAEIDAALDGVRASRIDIGIERHAPWLEGDTLSTSPESEIVAAASAACGALGRPGTPEWVPYGSDASKFQEGGVPAVVFGPGSIAQAHALDEYVPVSDLVTATAFYREVALVFGTGGPA